MAMFPAFIDLQGKKCVIIGGGKVAARKIRTLLMFNPRITVVSPEINETVQALKHEDKVVVLRKKYSEEDIENAFLVIAATDNPAVNERVHADAIERKILVNVVDCPAKCTFVFPSVVVRKDLVVGISTSGSYPALSKKVREKVEAFIPELYGEIIGLLKVLRQRAEQEIDNPQVRRQLLDRILDEVMFYENAITDKQMAQRIDDIFKEYKV